jgi:predicted ATPase
MAREPLIGRESELDEIARRLNTHRLVTVVGPAGAGKTSLARAAAARAATAFPLGTFEVDLTRVEHDDAVPGSVAGQLGFDSFESLLDSPVDQPALLIIDNCEHMLDAVAACVVRVLGACRQPVVLATSRSPLELPGESVVSIAPLPVPGSHDEPGEFAAVRLFLERMRDAGADPDTVDLAAVAELCRRLDGLPLALEFAAARSRSLSIPDILRGLDDDPALLDRPRFRGVARHRSIDEAIRWSYDLLSSEARGVLEHVSVFAGPFTASGASAVAGVDVANAEHALDELVAASLVGVDTSGRVTRFRLLDTVRRFAGRRLRESGNLDASYDRFADHVVAGLGEMLSGATDTWRPRLISDLVASFDDSAEALRWCVRHDDSPRRAFTMCGALWGMTHQAHAGDIAQLADLVLQRWPDRGSQSGAAVTATLATAAYATGGAERAVQLATAALERLPSVGPSTVTLHRVIGQSTRALGDLDSAIAAFRTGALIGHELGMTAMALELDVAAAVVVADLGDPNAAIADLEVVIDHATVIGSALTIAWSRTALGWVTLRTDPASAGSVIDAALAESVELDYPIGIAAGLRSRVYAELLDGRRAAAVTTAHSLIDDLLGRAAHSNARLMFDVAAVIAHDAGHGSWRPLVAAARAAPITTLLCAHHELVPLPVVSEAAPSVRDSIRLARQVVAELAAATPRPDRPVGPEPSTDTRTSAHIRRLGELIEFTFAGHTGATRASKGITDIVTLVQADGRDVHCVELAGVTVEQTSTGAVIDTTARRQYEQRIRDLQADIDEAEGNSDYARVYRYQTELDALIEHLTAALGHGGRTRRSTDATERARSAVTHRIRSAVRQIAACHPGLGAHLERAVVTGVFCSYRPERSVRWVVD